MDGTIKQGGVDEVIGTFVQQDETALELFPEGDVEVENRDAQKTTSPSKGGGLTVAEEMDEGHVSWPACALYHLKSRSRLIIPQFNSIWVA